MDIPRDELINEVGKIVANSDDSKNNNNNRSSRPSGIPILAQQWSVVHSEQGGPLIDREKWELGQLFRRPTMPILADRSESTTLDDEDQGGRLIETTCSKYAKAILPHVGLILLSMIYVITGASAFYYLERPNELRVRRTYVRNVTILKVNFLKDVWYSGREENRLLESKSTEVEVYRPSLQFGRPEAENRLERITKKLFEAFDTHYVEAVHLLYDEEVGSVNSRTDNRTEADDVVWTFNAAIFFSSTLLTTIGYGNLVPVTFEGRVFCICYGLLGVPLILITVTDIGKFLAEHITSTYGSYAEWRRRLRASARRRRNKRRNRTAPAGHSIENGGPSMKNDQLIALVPKTENRDHADDSLSPMLGDQANTKNEYDGDEIVEEQNEDDEDSDHEAVSDPFVVVPTPIILSILVGYMLLGALLISYLENWTFFDGFYFAFISLTTIGFGDYVPENQSYYTFDMLYIFFGLAITTMCIDLVGAQYIEKIHNFGRAIKDARYALINVGGKMVQVRDLMKYSAFLHKKYGLTENRARLLEQRNSLLAPKSTSKYPDAFTPREIRYIKYIDYVISSDNLVADIGAGTPSYRSRSNSNFTTYSAIATTSSSRA